LPHENDSKKEEAYTLDWQYTVSNLCTSNPWVYRGWEYAFTSTPQGRPTPPTSQPKVQTNVLSVSHKKDKPEQDSKCSECSVGLCVDLWVCHIMSQIWDKHHIGKSRTTQL
jgi:hypothetical protein